MKKHWWYLVARYGASPAICCVAGEAIMPYYFSETKEEDVAKLKKGWNELTHYLLSIDPYHHPITAHPAGGLNARQMIEETGKLDINMLHTGHSHRHSLENTVNHTYGLRRTLWCRMGPLFAGLVVAIIPTIIFYLIFHRSIIKGISTGAIKG